MVAPIDSKLTFDVATAADIDGIHALLASVIAWLRGRGIDQWPEFSRQYVADGVRRGEFFVLREDREIRGACELVDSDIAIWGQRPPDALYVHRLAVDPRHAGRGLGREILEQAAGVARHRGRLALRLDCQSGSARLRRYYRDAGFAERADHVIHVRGDRTYDLTLLERLLDPGPSGR